MGWSCTYNVTNCTDRDLKISNKRLHWGTWYRNNKEDNGPLEKLGVGETCQIVRAEDGGPVSGIEFYCTWKDDVPEGKNPYGDLTLGVNMQYAGKSSALCQTSGDLVVEGWEAPKNSQEIDGHFIRSITVTTKNLQMLKNRSRKSNNEFNWQEISGLKAVNGFTINDFIPKDTNIELRHIARSETTDLSVNAWEYIKDPDFDLGQKNDVVKRYYTVAVYSMVGDSKNIISVVAGGKGKYKEEITVSETGKQVSGGTYDLQVATGYAYGNKTSMHHPYIDITAKYQLTTSLEQTTTKSSCTSKEIEISSDKNIQVIPWIFKKSVLIYRETIDNQVDLIGGSTWDMAVVSKSYDADH